MKAISSLTYTVPVFPRILPAHPPQLLSPLLQSAPSSSIPTYVNHNGLLFNLPPPPSPALSFPQATSTNRLTQGQVSRPLPRTTHVTHVMRAPLPPTTSRTSQLVSYSFRNRTCCTNTGEYPPTSTQTTRLLQRRVSYCVACSHQAALAQHRRLGETP